MKIFATLILSVLVFILNAQDFALTQLNNSPRHAEWQMVKYQERTVKCFVVYPEISDKATVVIVIHENRGLTDWVRSFSDQLAEKGFIAIAPDFLSDFDSLHSSTTSFSNSDEARDAIYKLSHLQVMSDLEGVRQYASGLNSSNGKIGVVGFCWGGSQSFSFAGYSKKINAAFVFYGTAPADNKTLKSIEAPVYGFYGGNDERINAGIPETEKRMQTENKKFEYEIFPGAGHAFMRSGDDPAGSSENRTARNNAWDRLIKILSAI